MQDVLIVDDLGLRPLRHDEPVDLYELIRRRHRPTSTIVSSNRDIEEWPPLFLDPVLASAALDRLLEGAHALRLDGDTYRNPPPEKAPRRRAS
jgi:DNA replication protein DnaC